MSKSKVSFLVVGFLAIAAAVLAVAGTGILNSPSTANADVTTASLGADDAQTSSLACSKSATAGTSSCSKSATAASAACPSSAAMGGDKDKAGCGASCTKACPASSSCGSKQAKSASVESIDKREGSRVVLVGRYVCGSCDLGVSEKCAAAFQAKDGKNYLLVKNNLTNDLKENARETDVEIITVVKKFDGRKFLQVEVINPVS